MTHSLRSLALLGLIAALAACSGPTPTPTEPVPTVEGWETEAVATAGTPEPIPVTLGLPYMPDVQFAPLYVAQARGYYEAEGFDVTFEYGDESTFVRLVAGRSMPAVIASGEQVIMARAEDIPVVYVMTWYQRFAGVVFSDDPEIQTPADLVDRTVGLPFPSGASYTGWMALLATNEIDSRDVTTKVIGYTQPEAVLQGRVDAAVGYAANEPVQLRNQGIDVSVIEIADSFNFASNGLVVSEGLIDESPEVVQALVTGTLKGIRDTLEDPDAAFEIVLEVVLETAASPTVRDQQRQVLEESLRFWETPRLGTIDLDVWRRSQDFLLETEVIDTATPIEELVDTSFVDAADLSR